MRVYFVETPSVSTSYRTLYGKKLEVFSGVYNEDKREVRADQVFRYSQARDKWYEPNVRSMYKVIHIPGNRLKVLTAVPQAKEINLYTVFATKELAMAAKLVLLDNLKHEIKKDLNDIMAEIERKIPNTETAIAELQEEHPEMFI